MGARPRCRRQEGQARVPDPGFRESAPRPSAAMTDPALPRTTRILVVEDEPDVGGLIAHALERDGQTTVDLVGTGDAALAAIAERAPDVVVLDLNLPVLSGFEVCRILRGRPATRHLPIIMVTARTHEVDRIAGLDMGADDYVTKPFSLRELSARVRALLRRSQRPVGETESVYRGRQIVADFAAVSVAVDGADVRLTRREFELLKCLVENRNRVLSRERLLERVWGYDRLIETRSVDVHVGRLRAKLGTAGRQIETAVGLGYRFVE
jgi:two-component system, OmpR family, alkaline phosphatase synthesis response regulator PhoP